MKLKVIACGVFEPELQSLAERSQGAVELCFLDAGLHATPNILREQVQAHVDAAEGCGYGAIVVVYGLCGRGTVGIVARDVPVVIPRVHDCMTLFLGSREEYRRQFASHPGTFYTTPGWYEKKRLGGPLDEEPTDDQAEACCDPRYEELAGKYGAENAADIIRFYDSWKRSYTRAAFIDTGFGDRDRYADYAQDMADSFGWAFEVLPGQTALLERLLAGQWPDRDALVLQPGHRSALSGDERLFESIRVSGSAVSSHDHQAPATPTPVVASPGGHRGSDQTPAVGLGVDAGGTYTDCVLYDLRTRQVLAKSKGLTTPHELMIGIDDALNQLPAELLPQASLVALSTTLATNSIVEGKGGIPGALIMSATSVPAGALTWKPLRVLSGQMAIDGREIEAPDPAEITAAVREMLAQGVDAFAISGYASVKNPVHELAVKGVVQSLCDLPVVCGHELSSRLDFVSRANTAILNARLMPVIRSLLDAVSGSLEARGIHATLMVVKGDGSLVNRRTALERPIETVLSGPAASVSGARFLTGLDDAIVLDMGGTTTDTAVVEGGTVRISPQGARVGGWQTSVEAAEITTTGLGGDSYLRFTADRKLRVGPRRVIPLAYLCRRHPAVREALLSLRLEHLTDRSTPAVLDHFVLARPDYTGALDERESITVEALRPGPLSRGALARRTGALSPQLVDPRRLEELGVVQRSALTPTDLLHLTGEFLAWDTEAAAHAFGIFAGLYGMAPDALLDKLRTAVIERLAGEIIAREWPGACGEDPDTWPTMLRTAVRPDTSDRLSTTLSYDRPIVAIGAPVEPFFPQVAQLLGGQVVIPEHAEVANAIGAIAAEVVVREKAVVRPGEIANYVVYARSGRSEHEMLGDAVEAAKAALSTLARERAASAGTYADAVRYHVDERRAYSAEGDEVLVEVRIEATVSGTPALVV